MSFSLIIGMLFNPMNILAYRFSDLYISQTLFYGGLLMASNMMWAHEIVHYLSMGHFNTTMFIIGISLSLLRTFDIAEVDSFGWDLEAAHDKVKCSLPRYYD